MRIREVTEIELQEAKLESLDAKREQLYREWSAACDEARAQGYLVRDLRIEGVRAEIADMTVEQLREHVADLARNHGARAARLGRVQDVGGVEWGPFRAALAELAHRAAALPHGTWTEVEAQLVRIGDIEGEPVDDERPAELVFQATRDAVAKVGRAGLVLQHVRIAVRRAG